MDKGQAEVTVCLTNQKVQFTGVSNSNPDRPIAFDYVPPLGDGQGYKGLELLLMSFAGCVSTAIVVLLRRMGKNITGFKMNVAGIRREQPLSLQKICFEVVLESKDAVESDIEAVIKQAEAISPVWITLKNSVEVASEYKIIAS